MKTIAVILSAIILAGCSTSSFVRKEVVVKNEYVVRKASDQQKVLPPMPETIDIEKADQSALAEWIVRSEQRMLDLESIIKRLIEFYEKPVTEEERKKLEESKPLIPGFSIFE